MTAVRACVDAPSSPADESAQLLTRLECLRRDGGPQLDPLGFRYVEALHRRMSTAPAPVRKLLTNKFLVALADCEQRVGKLRAVESVKAPTPGSASTGTSIAPLAALNHYIQSLGHQGSASVPGLRSDRAHGLRSVRGFRQSWSRIRAEQRVALAVQRGPENAGPLNSHSLVLQSLALMQSLSPEYLQHFLAQVDSLLWLEQAGPSFALAPAKTERRKGAGK